MKKHILKLIITIAKSAAILSALFFVYLFFLERDIKKVDNFCSEMVPGLDINQVHTIANKYDVGFNDVRDPNSVKNKTLGIKVTDKENTWFFSVGAPMTFGEHACDVYHDYHVVLSAKSGGEPGRVGKG